MFAQHRLTAALVLGCLFALILWTTYSGATPKLSVVPSTASAAHGSTTPDSQHATPGPATDRALITYVYAETAEARKNLKFFIRHGLHNRADFVFIFNGETDAPALLPEASNIRSVRRNNTCYDLGSHAEVLQTNDLWKHYKRFILMNASVRGPFMPHWSDSCWSERFLSKVTDEVKLVGLSLNCWPTAHVQSMLWATDRNGLSLLLNPPASSPSHDKWMATLFSHKEDFPQPADYVPNAKDPSWTEPGLSKCFENRQQAVEAEIASTGIILGAGKRVDVMLMKMQTESDYLAHCARLGAWDPQGEGNYDGASISLFETIFIKTNRGISPKYLENMSNWIEKIGYSSYDYC